MSPNGRRTDEQVVHPCTPYESARVAPVCQPAACTFLSVRTPTASRLVVGASRPVTPVERQACLLSGERMCDTAHGECPWTVGSTGWNAVPAELG